MVRKVYGTNGPWYEWSTRSTKKSVVRIVNGTKSIVIFFVFRTFNLSTSGLKHNVKILYYAKIVANVSS